MAELAAGELALEPRQVIVASTGVIGAPLRIGAIEKGIGALAASLRGDEAGSEAFLEAIMTTDTRKKTGALEFDLEGRPIRIGAVVKGSGMIHPNMGTMLCFITTDIAIEQPLLNEILQGVVNRSFNRLTVDGDTSTNDMALVMASGLAGNRPLRSREEAGAFEEALLHLCVKLVRDMARDGEGATKLITVTVRGAGDEEEAAILAKSVAGSSLVKAACFGADANWGRVLCALGYGGVPFDPEKCAVQFAGAPGEIPVFQKGLPLPVDEGAARDLLSGEEIEIRVQVGTGPGEAQAWGCDLSYEYVKINGDYRS
jgi:glutamate N-acetyltransferase/amino-acid N-acetyltransferase